MTDVDLRAFVYLLEPLRRRRQWQLDAALALLGEQRQKLASLEIECEALREECLAQAARAARVWRDRADPAAQGRLLGYLAALQQQQTQAQYELTARREVVEQARAECAGCQQQLEMLQEHRESELMAFASEQQRKASVEADRDWGGRDSYRRIATEFL
jgi:hypothetical protein